MFLINTISRDKIFSGSLAGNLLAVLGASMVLFGGIQLAAAASSPWARTDQSAVRLISPLGGFGEAKTIRLGLQFRLKPGWKIYWRSPGDAGVPPEIDWKGSRNLENATIRWPLPERFNIFGLTTMVYGREVVLPLDLRVKASGAELALRARVTYLVCEKICIPYEARLTLDLSPGVGTAAPRHAAVIERYSRQVPRRIVSDAAARAPFSVVRARLLKDKAGVNLEVLARSRDGFAVPDLLVEGPRPFLFGRLRLELSEDNRVALFRAPVGLADKGAVPPDNPLLTLTLTDSGRALEQVVRLSQIKSGRGPGLGFMVILGLAFLGGLILNLMPCVLPVLSMKVLSVVGHGGAEVALVRRGFLATVAGILFSFLVLAGIAIALKSVGAAVGWGIQFQVPLFLIAMSAILVLFAANLFGYFEIPLPGFAGQAPGTGKGIGGAFATGAFATLLATPCSVPFLGTAIGFALSRGPTEILAVFTMLGLGLAVPYLVVAAWPRMATGLPRPGAWMVVLRQVLGGILLLTVLWLLSVLWVLVSVKVLVAVGALLAGLFAALILRHAASGLRPVAMGLAAACLIAVLAVTALTDAPVSRVAVQATGDSGIPWQPFNKVRLLNHVAEDRVVFVDVTADWCITCKANKALVIDRDAVAQRLRGASVVAMRADWTRPDPKIFSYLRSFGRFGVPFNAVYGPSAPQGIALGELLTEGAVLAAMKAAAAPRILRGQ